MLSSARTTEPGGLPLPPVIAVAGGTGALGRAICLTLVRGGCRLAFTFHRAQAEADKLMAEIGASGGEGLAAQVDLRSPDAVRDFFCGDVASLGPLAGVVYAAGPPVDMLPVETVTPDCWASTMDIDVDGAFHFLTAGMKALDGGGAIVAVIAAAILRLPRNDALSAVPKAAIEMLIKSIAKEKGKSGIRANCVAPGWIDAGIGARMMQSMPPAQRARAIRAVPLRRAGTTEEVARAVAFLLSDDAAYITGQTIAVDGGCHI